MRLVNAMLAVLAPAASPFPSDAALVAAVDAYAATSQGAAASLLSSARVGRAVDGRAGSATTAGLAGSPASCDAGGGRDSGHARALTFADKINAVSAGDSAAVWGLYQGELQAYQIPPDLALPPDGHLEWLAALGDPATLVIWLLTKYGPSRAAIVGQLMAAGPALPTLLALRAAADEALARYLVDKAKSVTPVLEQPSLVWHIHGPQAAVQLLKTRGLVEALRREEVRGALQRAATLKGKVVSVADFAAAAAALSSALYGLRGRRGALLLWTGRADKRRCFGRVYGSRWLALRLLYLLGAQPTLTPTTSLATVLLELGVQSGCRTTAEGEVVLCGDAGASTRSSGKRRRGGKSTAAGGKREAKRRLLCALQDEGAPTAPETLAWLNAAPRTVPCVPMDISIALCGFI